MWLPLTIGTALLLMAMLGVGVGLVTASVGARARDVRLSLTYGIGFLYFLTPIIYPFESIPDAWKPIAQLNPVTGALELFKLGLFPNEEISPKAIAITVAAVFAPLDPRALAVPAPRGAQPVTDQASESAADLEEELALAVRGISKTYGSALESLYEPAVSLFALLRERRGAAPAAPRACGHRRAGGRGRRGLRGRVEADESLGAPHYESSNLRDLSFELRRGEAIGVVGEQPAAIRTLARGAAG